MSLRSSSEDSSSSSVFSIVIAILTLFFGLLLRGSVSVVCKSFVSVGLDAECVEVCSISSPVLSDTGLGASIIVSGEAYRSAMELAADSDSGP